MAQRKLVTLRDIAQRLRVSPAVVSTALSGRNNGIFISASTRARVLDMAQQLGYQPRSHRRAKTETAVRTTKVAILSLPWYSPLFGETLAELNRTLAQWGFRPFLHVAPEKATSCKAGLKLYREGEADALIMLGSRGHPEEVAVGEAPCIVIGEAPSSHRLWRVCVDNVHGGRLVGEHLWRLGHRRVGVVTFADSLYCEKRVAGLRSVWEEQGEPWYEHRVLRLRDIQLTDIKHIQEELPLFLQRATEREGAPLTALFCTGDRIAAPIMRVLKERGSRIPEDISVVGFDDASPLAECLDPPLTTVRQPFIQLGHLAAQLLRERMERRGAEPREILLPGELVVRQSCAPASESRSLRQRGKRDEVARVGTPTSRG